MPRVAKLAIVKEREGNPGRRPIEPGVRLEPVAPPMPDWKVLFPTISVPKGSSADKRALKASSDRCRAKAEETWNRVVPILDAQGLLATADADSLTAYCVLVARIEQCERDISLHGIWLRTDRGTVKNPSTTIVNQYRAQIRPHYADFGLTPLARDRLNPRKGTDGDDLFD